MTRTSLVSLLLLSACSRVTVSGEVDGAVPELTDVFYVETKDSPFEDDSKDGVVTVQLLGIPDACDTWATYLDLLEVAEDTTDTPEAYAKAYAETWASLFPQAWWTLDVQVRIDDPSDPLDNAAFDGTDWERTPAKDDEFKATLTQYNAWLDENWANGDTPDSRYFQQWSNDEGELVLNRVERSGRLDGILTMDLVESEDGDEAGDMALSFSAERCVAAEP